MLGTAFRDLHRAGVVAVAAVLLSGLTVMAVGGTLLGLGALARLTAEWRTSLRLVVVLRALSASPGDSDRVVSLVRALPGVAAVRYISAEDALADLQRYLSASVDGLERLPANPLPARLEVSPARTLSGADLQGLVDVLGHLAGVDEVQAAIGWVEPAERLTRGLRIGGLTLGLLLGLGTILAVGGATRAARHARADESAVLRLFGVPEARIRGPLVLQAILQGGAGAVLGLGALLLVSEAGAPWLGEWLRATVGLAPLPLPPWPLWAALFGGGLALGLVGGLAAGRP